MSLYVPEMAFHHQLTPYKRYICRTPRFDYVVFETESMHPISEASYILRVTTIHRTLVFERSPLVTRLHLC